MSRFTTIVAVIAPDSSALVRAVASEATNVSAVLMADAGADEVADRRRTAWLAAKRGRNVYTLVDFDPLQLLVEAWVYRLQGRAQALEAAVATLEPDGLAEYVLVADDVEGDVVHWYHGLLGGFAPGRVMAVKPQPASVLDALSHLKGAPAFPSTDDLARAALEYVPTGMSVTETGKPELIVAT